MFGAALRSGQKPEMEQRRHFRYSRFERVSLLRFFARLQRNEVPPRIGANSNKQENTIYASRCGEQKDSTLSPHSPRAAPPPPPPPKAASRPLMQDLREKILRAIGLRVREEIFLPVVFDNDA